MVKYEKYYITITINYSEQKMKIGITYDTPDTYGLSQSDKYICDLCDEESINHMAITLSVHGHDVVKIKGIKMLLNYLQDDFDIILNSAEGFLSRNREALIPSLLEANGFNYIGADAYISAITLDKFLTSEIVSSIGIKSPKQIVLRKNDYKEICETTLPRLMEYPVVLKPNLGGNSSGMFVCQNLAATLHNAEAIFSALPNEQIICQEFIFGTEITVPIFGNGDNVETFGVIGFKEQQNDNFWINTEQKVFGGVTETKITLSPEVETEVIDLCKRMYRYLQFRDYSRFDFRIRGNEIYFLEANAFPYLGEDGAMFEAFKRNGYTYYDFLMYLIDIAQKRNSIL